MFNLTVTFGPNSSVMQFFYKDKKSADDAYAAIINGATVPCEIGDDFGLLGSLKDIHGVVVSDMNESLNAEIERQIMVAKAQIKAQNKAANDPAIKFSAANGGFALNHPGSPAGAAGNVGRRPF